MDRRNRPHTRIALSLLILALLMPVGGCGGLTAGTSPSLIEPNLDPATITRIQIMPDYNGNPRGSNPAKDITNPQEIAAFVAAFQNAQLGEETETLYGNASIFRFFSESGLTHQFSFSVAPGHPAYTGNNCTKISYTGDDPWALYAQSLAAEYAVDKDFNPTFQIPLPSSLLQVMQVPSRALKQDMAVSVYLPAGYGEHGDSRDSYPVLYMLHGYTGSETTWMPGLKLQETADTLIADGSIGPLIIIAPNIDNSYGIDSAEEPSQLGSSPQNSLNEGLYETWLIEELIPWVDSTYYTHAERAGRSIGGLSMGGCAALHLAFAHPELFVRASGHSPALFVEEFPSGLDGWLYPTETLRDERDPLRQAETADLSGLSVWLDCGDEDSYRFYEGCDVLEETLTARGVPVVNHLNPGLHDGAYWMAHAEEYLRFHAGVE